MRITEKHSGYGAASNLCKIGNRDGAYVPTIWDAYLDKGSIRKLVDHEKQVGRVIASSRFGCSLDSRNNFVLVLGNGVDSSGPWAANVIQSFKLSVSVIR